MYGLQPRIIIYVNGNELVHSIHNLLIVFMAFDTVVYNDNPNYLFIFFLNIIRL